MTAHPTHVTIPGRVKLEGEARGLPMVEVRHVEHPSVKSRKLHGKFRGFKITVPVGKRLEYELVVAPPRADGKPRPRPITPTLPKYRAWLVDDEAHFVDHPDQRKEDGTLVPAHRELRRGKKPADAPKAPEAPQGEGSAPAGAPHPEGDREIREG